MDLSDEKLQSLDLVFFSGDSFFSRLVEFGEYLDTIVDQKRDFRHSEFSHVGIIIKNDILQDPRLDSDKIYIWESLLTGVGNDKIKDIDGKYHFGVQLRDLQEVVDQAKLQNTKVAISKLRQNIRDSINVTDKSVRDKFADLFRHLNGLPYTTNPLTFMATIFPCLRKNKYEINYDTTYFCSQLVVETFRRVGIYPENVVPKTVLPTDIIFDSEKKIPEVVLRPVYIAPHEGEN